MHTCIPVRVCARVCTYTGCKHASYACIHTCMRVCVFMCVSVRVCVCMCALCTYVHTYKRKYMYTHARLPIIYALHVRV